MNNNYKYSLAKGSKKLTCPSCNRPKCFKPYTDNETGEILHETVGRCDHEQSCRYHYKPSEYFRDHPEHKTQEMNKYTTMTNKIFLQPYIEPEYTQEVFFPLSWAEEGAKRTSPFHTWFNSLPFDKEIKTKVLKDYYVGATQNDVCLSYKNYGHAVVFWMIDQHHRVHDAKLIAYHTTGHRVEGWANSMRAICEKTGKGPKLEQTEKVFFGLHLLDTSKDKPICLVESEKTALVCACRYPQFIWMATGGCSNLQLSKLRPLKDRRLVVYPDSGEYDKWKQRMEQSQHQNYSIVDFLEQYEDNTDIADIILGEAHIKKGIWQKMKENNPCLTLLEEEFGLVQ